MLRLIDANELIRFIKDYAHPDAPFYRRAFIEWINDQPHIIIDKANSLDDVKRKGVFVARKEK